MSPPGATNPAERADSFFLPNFCDPRIVLGVVLISELLALTFSFVRPGNAGFFVELARISVLLQWFGLTSAGVLCVVRPRLAKLSTPVVSAIVIALVLGNVGALSIVTVYIGQWIGSGDTLEIFPVAGLPFVARNVGIALIVTALLLRYLFVTHQWRRHVESEARSRIDALQARIRPHFLFNSMNTIAALTRSDPARAEEAVEDLSDLFRVTLRDAGKLLSLKEELELSRIYQRIEMLRLGDRLKVVWDVGSLPMRARLPGLTVQPLLENAIYHGIEPLDHGGTVTISGRCEGDQIEIAVSNPKASQPDNVGRRGNQIALENIRERLSLAFAGNGSLEVEQGDDFYCVRLRFPLQQ